MTEFAVDTSIHSDRRSPLRWVISHVLRHKVYLILMFIGAFLNAALASVVPILIGVAFDAALASPADLRTIGLAALGIVISQLVRAVVHVSRNFSSEIVGQRLERDTRHELYVSLLGKSMTFHGLQPVGDTMARATNDVREVNRMMNPGVNLVVGSANFLLMPLLLAPRYDPALELAPVFFLITYVLALARYLNVLNPVTDRVRLAFGEMNSRLAESIDGIETVKGAAQEDQEIELFRVNAREYRDAMVQQGRIEARFLPLLLLGVTLAIGFTHAFVMYRGGRIAVGDIVAYMGLLSLFGFPTFVSLMAYSQVSLGMAGARRILELINRTYDVTSGRVLVDGVDVRHWDLAALRRQISIIEQDVFLFSRTVAENIAFGCPSASREEIVAAAKAAQAHEFIETFRDGYNTVIGERGTTLSGGQRQRLAIARAFLTEPHILILDDSTSAVDSATEDRIQQAIAHAAERQTTILITHRLSQIRWADKVILMRKGRLLAVGDHNMLMAEHQAYRRIFEQYAG